MIWCCLPVQWPEHYSQLVFNDETLTVQKVLWRWISVFCLLFWSIRLNFLHLPVHLIARSAIMAATTQSRRNVSHNSRHLQAGEANQSLLKYKTTFCRIYVGNINSQEYSLQSNSESFDFNMLSYSENFILMTVLFFMPIWFLCPKNKRKQNIARVKFDW